MVKQEHSQFFRSIFIVVIIAVIALSVGCNRKSAKVLADDKKPDFSITEELEIGFGQQVCATQDKNICVRLDSVIDDSRCPRGLNCIWEGNAKMRFTLTTMDSLFSFDLDSHPEDHIHRNDTLIGGYRIAFKKLTPYPTTEYQFKDSAYVAFIGLSKP